MKHLLPRFFSHFWLINRCLLLLFLVICVTNVMYGQTTPDGSVVGMVTDERGHPFSDASVLLVSSRYEYPKGTLTDAGGVFEIDMRPGDSLRISYVGYASEWRSYEEMLEVMEIPLQLDEEAIPGVEVVAKAPEREGHILCCCIPLKEHESVINLGVGKAKRIWNYYPNPVVDHVTVETEELEGVIRVVSLSGIELARLPVSNDRLQINLSGVPAGTYVLKYEREGWSELIGRVVKVDE